MDRPNTTHEHPRRRRRLTTLLVLSLVSGSVGAGALSLAVFTDSKAIAGNTFTTGTIILGVNPASTLLTSANMMPGDDVNGTLLVSNTGTGALRYAMTSTSTNLDGKGLMSQVTLTIKTLGGSCAAFDGASIYTSTLAAATLGDPTQGPQTGDRPLAGGASETLCFRATLPLASGNAFQNATTTTTFTFQAEQTANNP